jgi:hypothetical protein
MLPLKSRSAAVPVVANTIREGSFLVFVMILGLLSLSRDAADAGTDFTTSLPILRMQNALSIPKSRKKTTITMPVCQQKYHALHRIDLAWGSKTPRRRSCWTASDLGATLIASPDSLLTDDEILAFVRDNDTGGGLLVAIDAPTIVPNETGRRPCEATLSRCMAKAQAGPHPANRTLLSGADGTVRGERIAAALAAQGLPQTPYLDSLPAGKPPAPHSRSFRTGPYRAVRSGEDPEVQGQTEADQ